MKVFFNVTCPYCKMEQRKELNQHEVYANFYTVYCDNEAGGCDLPFTISLELKPIVYVFKLEKSD